MRQEIIYNSSVPNNIIIEQAHFSSIINSSKYLNKSLVKFNKYFMNKNLLIYFIKIRRNCIKQDAKHSIILFDRNIINQKSALASKLFRTPRDKISIYDNSMLGIFKYIKVDDNFDTIYIPRIINSISDIEMIETNFDISLFDYYNSLPVIHW